MHQLTPAVVQMSELSELELKFFTKKLQLVPKVLMNLEFVKLYGRKKILDIGKADSKSTKGNTTPDIIDLGAVDLDSDIRSAMFSLCREYEEHVRVAVTDLDGNVTGQALIPPVESSDPAVMIAYLSDPASLEWMRFVQGFEESACEIVALIDQGIEYTTAVKEEKVPAMIGLEKMRDRFIDQPEDYPRTPVQILRLINKAGYPLTAKVMHKWIENKSVEPVALIGKSKAYRTSDMLTRYISYLQNSASRSHEVSFVNRVA